MQFLNSIKDVNKNISYYQKWEHKQQDEEAKREYLAKNVEIPKDKLELAQNKGITLLNAIETIDEYSEDKSEEVEFLTEQLQQQVGGAVGFGSIIVGAICALPFFAKKKPRMAMVSGFLGMILSGIGASSAFSIFTSDLQKKASRIARFEACDTKLKDPKNFVTYTTEQIEQAQNIAKDIQLDPEEEKKKKKKNNVNFADAFNPLSFLKPIKTAKQLLSNNENYKDWKARINKVEQDRQKYKNKPITESQMQKAKDDQAMLLRLIKKIDLSAQEYSENIEMGTNIATGSGMLVGLASGQLIKWSTKLVEKLGHLKGANKLSKILKHNYTSFGLGIFLSLGASAYGLSLQKKASRVGRYKAKQELMQDPKNFIRYSDEQMQSADGIKAKGKQSFWKSVLDDFKFFFKARKDFRAYDKYQKTTDVEHRKIRMALKQVAVSDKQLKSAEHLQDKTFRTFDKMDEMSERYAEDAEALGEIVNMSITSIITSIASLKMIWDMNKVIGKKIHKLAPKVNKSIHMSKNKFKSSQLAKPMTQMIVPVLICSTLIEIASTKYQKLASKIGIMKTIEELKDPKDFVDYDDEKILSKVQVEHTNNNQDKRIGVIQDMQDFLKKISLFS